MAAAIDDEDLTIIKASAGLLDDIESSIGRLLYKRGITSSQPPNVHTRARTRHVDQIVKLIDTFQSEPQLLDPRLKDIVPRISDVSLVSLGVSSNARSGEPVLHGLSTILYTLCKVRGRKVIIRLLNNEPRYLEPILQKLEHHDHAESWQVCYILLLWLAHLLLAPFDLASMSAESATPDLPDELQVSQDVPAITKRIIHISLLHLQSSSLAREAAADVLVRLAVRPDMQRLRIARSLTSYFLDEIRKSSIGNATVTSPKHGILRFLSGVAASADMAELFGSIYQTCEDLISEFGANLSLSDAVGKKLMIKTIRNLTMTSLRSMASNADLADFVEESGILENSIDLFIRSLSDRETLVRYSAAKSLSMIISSLDISMGQEIIQAVLEALKEEMPAKFGDAHLPTADPHAWHGLTLCIAYAMFNRSIPLEQIAEVVPALLAALNFEQRTATGTTLGTNARDAANFGLWSLSRRYTTAELSKVNITIGAPTADNMTLIQQLATHLVQASCLDPVGNVRRGSSAALQELVGRHPDQVANGISLIQAVDYQAVGLRRRAMIDVAGSAASLHSDYKHELTTALFGWRGVQATDVASRDAAAVSITERISAGSQTVQDQIIRDLAERMKACDSNDLEHWHGLILTAATWLENVNESTLDTTAQEFQSMSTLWTAPAWFCTAKAILSSRALRAELPHALTRLATAYCGARRVLGDRQSSDNVLPVDLDKLVDRLLNRSEDSLMVLIPSLVKSLPILPQCLNLRDLSSKAQSETTKPSVQGAGRIFAMAALSTSTTILEEGQEALSGLLSASNSVHVDWRVIGMKAFAVAFGTMDNNHFELTREILTTIHQGLQDFTIDERGDVGSLVRLESIACVRLLLTRHQRTKTDDLVQLEADILQLSLDRLDRVRQQAADCRCHMSRLNEQFPEVTSISSSAYMNQALAPLWDNMTPPWAQRALLEGLIACAGSSNERLLQTSRLVMAEQMQSLEPDNLHGILNTFTAILQERQTSGDNVQPSLDVLAFMLQMKMLCRLYSSSFKWRSLLSTVQKSHFKSTDVQRLMAAVQVYIGLADVQCIKTEVMKKLLSMLKTNPLPRVRTAVAEALFHTTADRDLLGTDWSRPSSQNASAFNALQTRYHTVATPQ